MYLGKVELIQPTFTNITNPGKSYKDVILHIFQGYQLAWNNFPSISQELKICSYFNKRLTIWNWISVKLWDSMTINPEIPSYNTTSAMIRKWIHTWQPWFQTLFVCVTPDLNVSLTEISICKGKPHRVRGNTSVTIWVNGTV